MKRQTNRISRNSEQFAQPGKQVLFQDPSPDQGGFPLGVGVDDGGQFVVEGEVEPKVGPLLGAGVAEHNPAESHRTMAVVQSAGKRGRGGGEVHRFRSH